MGIGDFGAIRPESVKVLVTRHSSCGARMPEGTWSHASPDGLLRGYKFSVSAVTDFSFVLKSAAICFG